MTYKVFLPILFNQAFRPNFPFAGNTGVRDKSNYTRNEPRMWGLLQHNGSSLKKSMSWGEIVAVCYRSTET